MSELYLVKWKNTEHPEVPVKNWFGVVRSYGYGKEEERLIARAKEAGCVLVDDCIFPDCKTRKLTDITPVSISWEKGSEEQLFNEAVTDFYEKKRPEKFGLYSTFSLSVADGRVTYMVTKVNKKTVKLSWFGPNNGDRYIDHHFGWGGTFPKSDVQSYVEAEQSLSSLFKK